MYAVLRLSRNFASTQLKLSKARRGDGEKESWGTIDGEGERVPRRVVLQDLRDVLSSITTYITRANLRRLVFNMGAAGLKPFF